MIKECKKPILGWKWFIYFISCIAIIAMSSALVIFLIDPCFQYRVKNNSLFFFERYVGPGLISNYDYDTLVIGSSRVQNFDMDLFREKLNVKPLLIGIGGLQINDLTRLVEKANSVGRAKTYYICIDLSMFIDDRQLVPDYLYDEDTISRGKYMTSYEVWFRFIPMDFGVKTAKAVGIGLKPEFTDKMNIDKFADWSNRVNFSEDTVIEDFIKNRNITSVSDQVDKECSMTLMKANIENFVSGLGDGEKYVFFFSPYSALWWCNTEDNGTDGQYYELKKYFVDHVPDNSLIYDFQYADVTLDLNNYCDLGHYGPDVNDWMIEQFANPYSEFIVNSDNIEEKIDILRENIVRFKEDHAILWSDEQSVY